MAQENDLYLYQGWRIARRRIATARAAFPKSSAILVLLGPKACGKTRLLNALLQQFRKAGITAYPFDGHSLPAVKQSDVLLVDNATEHLGMLADWLDNPPCCIILADRPVLSNQLIHLLTPTLFVHMPPLLPEEVVAYMATRRPTTGALVQHALPDGLDALANLADWYPGPLAAAMAETLPPPAVMQQLPPNARVPSEPIDPEPVARQAALPQSALAAKSVPAPRMQATPRENPPDWPSAAPIQSVLAAGLPILSGATQPWHSSAILKVLAGSSILAVLTLLILMHRPPRLAMQTASRPAHTDHLSELAATTLPLPRQRFQTARLSPINHATVEALPATSPPAIAPGLILVAHTGDTLPSLYRKVYDGMAPPDYTRVASLNPPEIQPGSLLIFPAPPGGWMPHLPEPSGYQLPSVSP